MAIWDEMRRQAMLGCEGIDRTGVQTAIKEAFKNNPNVDNRSCYGPVNITEEEPSVLVSIPVGGVQRVVCGRGKSVS